MDKKLLFALDIGTRSVIGLVGEQQEDDINIIAAERLEHNTRAMLDGQIHDVPEVAKIIAEIRTGLEAKTGPLTRVSIAAAGRALCTLTACAELDTQNKGLLTSDDERTLELAAIQAAQRKIATTDAVDDPTQYYCVGYSVVSFMLDGTAFKTLAGQRGKQAGVSIIATFLPCQVIDSLQAALQKVGLEIETLTLEPIAALNILIPQTMRHLNLALVDVGAGTSDIAITKDGTVAGYGMVPSAGDEITEAISRRYLLDFNVAEEVKRQLGGAKNKKISFTDVLGCPQKVAVSEIIHSITSDIAELARDIAAQILTLNSAAPQAVLLVGGGSMTPLLTEALAEALDILPSRVAIRRPDSIQGIKDLPDLVNAPDGVTPLGILKIAGSRTLNFVDVTLNGQDLHLFNLGSLTVADALLAGGINIRSLQGRPGLGITISVNGKTRFVPGTHGKSGRILLNGNPAKYTDCINEHDIIKVEKGIDGITPCPSVQDVLDIPEPLNLVINGHTRLITPRITINGTKADPDTKLRDRDEVKCTLPIALADILAEAGIDMTPHQYDYIINDNPRVYRVWPVISVNGDKADITAKINPGDKVDIKPGPLPSLRELLGINDAEEQSVNILFNGAHIAVPTRRHTVLVNNRPASRDDTPPAGSIVSHSCCEQPHPTVTDVLLTAEFSPSSLPPGSGVDILLNGQPAEYTALISSGDSVDLVIKNLDAFNSVV